MVQVACLCPPKTTGEVRHANGDRIELREKLDFRSALTARNAVVMLKTEDEDVSSAEILATLTEVYLLHGIKSWTLVDAKNKPIEVEKAAIREHLLSNADVAMEVGEEADALYSEAVITPLVKRAQRSSQPTQTDEPTSPTNGASPTAPRPSKRSSTSTTQTDAIATTS